MGSKAADFSRYKFPTRTPALREDIWRAVFGDSSIF
jgi:hypothetical protein